MNKINLQNVPSQSFRLSLENVFYRWLISWNTRQEYFTINLYSDEGVALVLGVPMLKGVNLLSQCVDIPIGALVMYATDINFGEATIETINNEISLYHLTEAELNGDTV